MATREPSGPGWDLPATAELLASGGDERVAVDPRSGVNQYSCRPFPDPELAALGSSTASVVSERGYAAAEHLRARLLQAAATTAPATAYRHALERMRQRLLALCGLSGGERPELVFAPSGTDLHMIAGQLVGAGTTAPTLAIMVDPAETGRHVPTALSGRPFCASPPLGGTPTADATRMVRVATVPVRLGDGSARQPSEVDAEVEALAAAALKDGRHVLLILADPSKTGLIAPGPGCARRLRQRWPQAVDVLIDACQFRIAAATLRAYLECGFMVAVTGSKFVSGPGFSAVLWLPAQLAGRYHDTALPSDFHTFSARADWPVAWHGAAQLPEVANFGLLLRWEAALAELEALYALPDEKIAGFLDAFAAAARARLTDDPHFMPVAVPPLLRDLGAPPSWDHIQTIFPFVPCRPSSGGFVPLTREDTVELYRQLQQADTTPAGDPAAALRVQLGQPVSCGVHRGQPVSALRLCASARLVVQAAHDESAAARVLAQAMAALDKTAWLARNMAPR